MNEDKRRFEDLEKIDSWQNTVEGWDGPNLRDTSRHLVHRGVVTKYSLSKSKTHTAERHFFLFDNVLIYCRKAGMLTVRGSKGRRLVGLSGRVAPNLHTPTLNLLLLSPDHPRAGLH